MLNIEILRHNLDEVKEKLAKRKYKFNTKKFLDLDARRKETQTHTESLQNQLNDLSKDFGNYKKEGKSLDKLTKEIDKNKNVFKSKQKELTEIQKQLNALLLDVPNLPSDDTPVGDDESNNLVLREHLQPINKSNKDHLQITNQINFDQGNALSGSRFPVISGQIAALHRALGSYMLQEAINMGYIEQYVPYIVNYDSLEGTGQLPKFEEDLFKLNNDQYLIPTAEVPLTNLYRDQVLAIDILPIKLTSHTPCFRSEAGSYGKDTKGLIRVHQFDKVELVHIVEPDQSNKTLDELVLNAESILKNLELPYRAVQLCTGDLGFSATKTIDLEVWIPSQNKYREISSCSNCTDFQSRRSKIRYKKDNKNDYVHTLNGSALAVGRTLVAILENFYDEKNNVVILPSALKDILKTDSITL